MNEKKPGEDWADPGEGRRRQVRKTSSKEVLSLCLWSQSRGPRRQTKRAQSPPLCSPPFASLLAAQPHSRRPHPFPPLAPPIPSHLKYVRAEDTNNALIIQSVRQVESTHRPSCLICLRRRFQAKSTRRREGWTEDKKRRRRPVPKVSQPPQEKASWDSKKEHFLLLAFLSLSPRLQVSEWVRCVLRQYAEF